MSKEIGETPLADIHVHSDCSHSAKSIHRRAMEFGIPGFGEMSIDEVRQTIHPPLGANWETWYNHLVKVRKAYTSPTVIGALIEDLMHEAAENGVSLLELRISLLSTTTDMLKNTGLKDPDIQTFWGAAKTIWDEILKARERANKILKTQTDLVMSISCQERYRQHVAELIELCLDHADHIVGIDLTNERDTPPSHYQKAIEKARSRIRGLTIHCMEVTGPERGWDALELNPDRIGHGINIVQDRALMEKYAERAIPIEVCLQSNLVTGIIQTPEDHPLKEMLQMGIPIVIGSDGANDGTTLAYNYELIKKTFSLSDEEMQALRQNSWNAAFRNKRR